MTKSLSSLLLFLFVFHVFAFAQSSNEELRVGIIKYKTEEKLNLTYAPMVDYLGEKLGVSISMEIVDEEKLAYELMQGNYDIGIFKPFSYLQSKVNFQEIEVFASQEVNGKDYYTGVILAKKSSNINSLKDFKGKTFLFIKPTSTSGFRYPKGIFKEHDIDIETCFSAYDFSYDHKKALRSLMNDEVDGIAVSKNVFVKFDSIQQEDYTIIKEYIVPNHAYVLSPKMDSTKQMKIKNIMLNAFKDPNCKLMFDNPLNITNWIEKDDDYYNYLRRYLRIVRVKPGIKSTLIIKPNAEIQLALKGDIISILNEEIEEQLLESNRFSAEQKQAGNTQRVKVVISYIDESNYRYQIFLNDQRIAKSNIQEKHLIAQLPKRITTSVLNSLAMETKLLSNGQDWFITFGTNDGINAEKYHFFIQDKNNNKESLKLKLLTDLNTYFEASDSLKEGQIVRLEYIDDKYKKDDIPTEILDMDNFWEDNFWDKFGIIVGAVIAMLSGLLGWYVNTRKKRRFKFMLTETNQLLHSFYKERIKQDQIIIELKDNFSKELEKGNITENQFLILKHKINEVESEISKQPLSDFDK